MSGTYKGVYWLCWFIFLPLEKFADLVYNREKAQTWALVWADLVFQNSFLWAKNGPNTTLSQLPDHYMSQDISGLQLPNTVCVPRGVCGNSSSTYKIEKTNGVFYTSSNRAFQILLLQWIPNCCFIFPQCSCIYFRGATQEQWGLQPRLVCPGWRPCGKIPWKLHHPGILGFTSKIVAWNMKYWCLFLGFNTPVKSVLRAQWQIVLTVVPADQKVTLSHLLGEVRKSPEWQLSESSCQQRFPCHCLWFLLQLATQPQIFVVPQFIKHSRHFKNT